MTLQKAIEGLVWLKDEAIFPKNQHDKDALQLGIEAMKYIYGQYDPDHQMMRKLLPGETKD